MNYYLLFDVGGTQIKAGMVNQRGELLENRIHAFDAKAGRDAGEIYANFAAIAGRMVASLPAGPDDGGRIAAFGMAWPGEFDYENGICLIRGLGKYEAIYGQNIREGICAALGGASWFTADMRFAYLHDVEAFALGECRYGSAKNSRKAIYLCIGTGAGSAFSQDGRMLKDKTCAAPRNGWIYDIPFQDGIIDDYLSVRGLRQIAARYFSDPPDGRVLYDLAMKGDTSAGKVFDDFGRTVVEALIPIIEKFGPDTLVFGGQVSKSLQFFGGPLTDYCSAHGIALCSAEDTSRSVFNGLYDYLIKKEGY
jgi:glucokinase